MRTDEASVSGGARVVQVLTLALLVGPVLVDLATSIRNRPFGYSAADTFYYLVVARTIVREGIVSFDGAFWSNGFHPLWQAVCALVYGFSKLVGLERHLVLVVVLTGLALIACGLWLLSRAWLRAYGRVSPAFVILPLGVYSLLLAPTFWDCRAVQSAAPGMEGPLPLYGTLWSYANGMESGAVLLFYGLLAELYTRCSESRTVSSRAAGGFGALAAGFTLARLDHGLLVLPILFGFCARAWLDGPGAWRNVLRALGAYGAPLVTYLLVNRWLFGSALPVSGRLKSTFPAFTSDHVKNLGLLLESSPVCGSLSTFWREMQLVIPLLAAVVLLPLTLVARVAPSGLTVRLRASCTSFDGFLTLTGVGVVLLGGYNFLFTPTYDQGHWYFPVSTLFVSLTVVSLLERVPFRAPPWARASAVAVILAVSVWVFVRLSRVPAYHARYSDFFWRRAGEVKAFYQKLEPKDRPRLIEVEDGLLGYSLDVPTMSRQLALDVEGVRAHQAKKLVKLAQERGFSRVSSLSYCDLTADARGPTSCDKAAWCLDESLAGYRCEVEYLAADKGFAIQRIVPEKAR